MGQRTFPLGSCKQEERPLMGLFLISLTMAF
jgi:hypothetical protein